MILALMGSHVEWQHLAFPKSSVSLQILLHLGSQSPSWEGQQVQAGSGRRSLCPQEGDWTEACSADFPRAAVLFSGHVASKKKARVPGHGWSTSSDVTNQRGDPPGLPKWQLWDGEALTAWDSPVREISRDITIFFSEELCDLRCWCQHSYKCTSV